MEDNKGLVEQTDSNSTSNTPEVIQNNNSAKIKKVLIILIVMLLIGITAISVYLLNRSSDEPLQLNELSATNEESNKVSELPESEYSSEYTLKDEKYGTMTTVTISAGYRNIISNALPNHDTGEFPNDGNPNTISSQNKKWVFPFTPTFTGTAKDVREPGVAINGVKFEPGTAERAVCSSGETYNIEALQDVTDLGIDFNNAHVQPNGEYHYHSISSMLVDIFAGENDLVHVGFAADGHFIYYSKSGEYKSSYKLGTGNRQGTNCIYNIPGPSGGGTSNFDWEKDGSLTQDWEYNTNNGDLDECNGIEIGGQYVYLITDEFPYISRCLNGEFTESSPPGNNLQQQGPPSGSPPRP